MGKNMMTVSTDTDEGGNHDVSIVKDTNINGLVKPVKLQNSPAYNCLAM